jgi:glycosyltransferase involved in cell wall biosynthesis
MKVSIIVPVYNASSRLKICLDSLISQTLDEIEIITVNDASSDNSLEILKEYKINYPDLFVIVNLEKNSGPGGARNNGIRVAKGEYIGFVDSDDTCSPGMFLKLYEKALEESADVADCDYYTCINSSMQPCLSNRDDQVGQITIEKKKSLIQYTGRMWTKIIRRGIFKDNSLSFPENVLYEDNELMPFLVTFIHKLAKVKEPLYYYYLNPTSITHNYSDRFFDRLVTSVNLKKRFVESGLYEIYKEEVDSQLIVLYYMNTLTACITHFHPPRIDKMYEIRNGIRQLVMNYRKNIYYSNLRFVGRISMMVNDISPKLLVFLYSFKTLLRLPVWKR